MVMFPPKIVLHARVSSARYLVPTGGIGVILALSPLFRSLKFEPYRSDFFFALRNDGPWAYSARVYGK